MCMRNININTLVFSMLNDDMSSVCPFDFIVAEETPKGLLIRDFNVLVLVSAIVSEKETDAYRCVLKNNVYDVRVRITHVGTNCGVDLDSYTLVFDDNSIHDVRKLVFESKRVIHVSDFLLPKGSGEYIIKVFIKHKDDDEWFTQSIYRFLVSSDG